MINMNVIEPSDVDETVEMLEIPQADVGHVFDNGTKEIIDLNPRSNNVQLIDVVNSSAINVVETQDQNLPTRQIKTSQVFSLL